MDNSTKVSIRWRLKTGGWSYPCIGIQGWGTGRTGPETDRIGPLSCNDVEMTHRPTPVKKVIWNKQTACKLYELWLVLLCYAAPAPVGIRGPGPHKKKLAPWAGL